jgi:hypothetical protein
MQNVIYIAKHFIVETTWFPDEVYLIHTILIPNVLFLDFDPAFFFIDGFLNQFVAVAWKHAEVLINRLGGLVDCLINFICFFHSTITVPRIP